MPNPVQPIKIPADWDDSDLLTFEQFCTLTHSVQRTVRDWRRRGVGPRFWKLDGTGRLYTSVGEVRRWIASGLKRPDPRRPDPRRPGGHRDQ